MVRLSIVLNSLNTAKLAAFKECLMIFQEKLKATISLSIIKVGRKIEVGVKLVVYVNLDILNCSC